MQQVLPGADFFTKNVGGNFSHWLKKTQQVWYAVKNLPVRNKTWADQNITPICLVFLPRKWAQGLVCGLWVRTLLCSPVSTWEWEAVHQGSPSASERRDSWPHGRWPGSCPHGPHSPTRTATRCRATVDPHSAGLWVGALRECLSSTPILHDRTQPFTVDLPSLRLSHCSSLPSA